MKKKIISFLVVLFITLDFCPQKSKEILRNELNEETIPKDTIVTISKDTITIIKKGTKTRDYVPDEETAKKIAEAIWIPIYGEADILKERPYKVKLVNDIWIVEGLIPEPYRYDPEVRGGGAYIEIRKKDCKILKVTHYM
jgi:hypothetical protein